MNNVNGFKHNHEHAHHSNSSGEHRKFCPYVVPTIYLLLEAILCVLGLYIVNMGADVQGWNKLIVSAVFLYFMFGSVRRYLNVVERSKIRCAGESHHKEA